jgi:hypothetical protein
MTPWTRQLSIFLDKTDSYYEVLYFEFDCTLELGECNNLPLIKFTDYPILNFM